MDKLILELTRLYLLDGQRCRDSGGDDAADVALTPALLLRHVAGERTLAFDLVSPAGEVRALLIAFRGASEARRAAHWDALCALANDMQTRLGLPAPAVSIAGADGYGVWLSLAAPIPLEQARRLLRALREDCLAGLPDAELALLPGCGHGGLAELPPCLHGVGEAARWAAFINPGMGASFAEEPGLEMAPPSAAQAAFLAGLESITAGQLAQALAALERPPEAQEQAASMPAAPPPAISAPAGDDTLLLKDATLEDIVRFLHARHIEPTFRHLLPGQEKRLNSP